MVCTVWMRPSLCGRWLEWRFVQQESRGRRRKRCRAARIASSICRVNERYQRPSWDQTMDSASLLSPSFRHPPPSLWPEHQQRILCPRYHPPSTSRAEFGRGVQPCTETGVRAMEEVAEPLATAEGKCGMWESSESVNFSCVIPGSAVSFLPAFVGCLPAGEKRLPFAVWLHCYTFSKEEARVEGSEEEGNQVSLSFASAILVAERSGLPQSSRAAERRSRVEAEAAARVSAQFPGYQAPYDFKVSHSRSLEIGRQSFLIRRNWTVL